MQYVNHTCTCTCNCVTSFCFPVGGGINKQEREITLTLKHGVEAKNYDDVRHPLFQSVFFHKVIYTCGNILGWQGRETEADGAGVEEA